MLSPDHIEDNWNKLNELVQLVNPPLSLLLKKFELNLVSIDNNAGQTVNYPGLKNAPAGILNHHAYEGGLVEHLLEMWNIHTTIYKGLNLESKDTNLHLKSNEILETILLHDLHKGYCFYKYPNAAQLKEFKAKPLTTPYFQRSEEDHLNLVGNNGVTLWMCTLAGYRISSLKSLNAVLNSEGGYSEIKTKWQTVLAKYVYVLDELSSNVLSRLEQGNVFDVRDKKNNQCWADKFLKDEGKA